MQRCAFCSRYLNPKSFACGYCGKKTGRAAPTFTSSGPVDLPPLEYAGGVVALDGNGAVHVGPAVHTGGHGGAGETFEAADEDFAAVGPQGYARRRWWRGAPKSR
jgi:hypothetical protein